MQLHRITLEDRAWVNQIVFQEDSKSADFNFGSMYIWDSSIPQYIAQLGQRLVVQVQNGNEVYFACPIGTGELEPVLQWMKTDSMRRGHKLVICGVTEDYLKQFQYVAPYEFDFEVVDAYADYIYSAQSLATLTGKKLHGKRNHINRFSTNYQWSYEPLTLASLALCSQLEQQWLAEQGGTSLSTSDERLAFQRAIEHYVALELEGGILYVDNKAVAFTIGEKIASDTFLIHFEKADTGIEGAYAMINREFIRQVLKYHPEVRYINREDDMGLENLRKAKRSYNPEFLVHKYTLRWKTN